MTTYEALQNILFIHAIIFLIDKHPQM